MFGFNKKKTIKVDFKVGDVVDFVININYGYNEVIRKQFEKLIVTDLGNTKHTFNNFMSNKLLIEGKIETIDDFISSAKIKVLNVRITGNYKDDPHDMRHAYNRLIQNNFKEIIGFLSGITLQPISALNLVEPTSNAVNVILSEADWANIQIAVEDKFGMHHPLTKTLTKFFEQNFDKD